MNANSIPLPAGLAWALKVDDMRELCAFDIGKDCYVWRWDTDVNGARQTFFAQQLSANTQLPYGDCPDMAFAEEKRKEAREYFNRIEIGMPPK